jgi:HK97 family phage portal protein
VFGFGKKTETTSVQAVEERSLASPESWLLELFGAAPSTAGIAVTSQNATRCTAVRAAVSALSEASGQLSLNLFRRGPNGSHEQEVNHPVVGLLSRTANPWTTAQQFREQLVRDALLHGDGFGYIVRDGSGAPRELHRLRPSAVVVMEDTVTSEPIYRINAVNHSIAGVVGRDNIIHIRAGLADDGITGVSPIHEARDAIGLALQLEAHAARLFANGGRPSGILSFPQKLGAEVAKRIKASWQAATGGSNSGGTAVLEEGGTFVPLAFSSVDAQYMELRAFAVTEIARAFRVPPIFIQDFGRATWSNSSEMGRMFLSYSLQPWLTRIEGEFALKLLTPQEREELFLEYDTDDITAAEGQPRQWHDGAESGA